MDHAAGTPYYFSQRSFIGAAPGRLIIHKALVRPVQALMAAWAEIEQHPSPGEIIGVEPGEDVPLRRDLILRAFAVNHGAKAIGFSVIERRHKLKPEYADRTGPQLVELKKQGIAIQHTIEMPLAAYCGDTAEGAFLDLDHVRNARLLIIECTFFEPDHVVRARAGKHLHVRDMRGILRRLRNPHILLTHVTRRTDMRSARRALESMVDGADLPRLTFLMDRPRRGARPEPEIAAPAPIMDRPVG
jgi:ribonuclease Z